MPELTGPRSPSAKPANLMARSQALGVVPPPGPMLPARSHSFDWPAVGSLATMGHLYFNLLIGRGLTVGFPITAP